MDTSGDLGTQRWVMKIWVAGTLVSVVKYVSPPNRTNLSQRTSRSLVLVFVQNAHPMS